MQILLKKKKRVIQENIEEVVVEAAEVAEGAVEENTEEEEDIEATEMGAIEVVSAEAEGEVEVTEMAEIEAVTVETIKMADSRTANSDLVVIAEDPEEAVMNAEAVEVNLIATVNDHNSPTAIEKMATTNKSQTEDKRKKQKTETMSILLVVKKNKTLKQQKKIKKFTWNIHAFVEHVFFAAAPLILSLIPLQFL